MSSRKEPCYLAPDFNCHEYPQNEEDYLQLFDGHQGQKRVGEATSTYLYSKLAAKTIHEYAPEAKIIAMLRNPVDLVASLHAQRLKEGNECFRQLEDAIEAEADRLEGLKIPVGFYYPKEYLLYREFGKYASQLERYFSAFGRGNVLVIVFDDFHKDTEGEFKKVCNFLGLSCPNNLDYTPRNSATVPRYLFVHRATILLTRVLKIAGKRVSPLLPTSLVGGLWRTYLNFIQFARKSNRKTGRDRLRSETRQALTQFFLKDIEKTEEILGRDLSSWKEFAMPDAPSKST